MGTTSTIVEFSLPVGYCDEEGTLHKNGIMRLARASDEIAPLKDPRVQANPDYLAVVVLSRVVTQIGTIDVISTNVIDNLFIQDFAHLLNLYNQVNGVSQEEQALSGLSAESGEQSLGNVEALSSWKSYMVK
jgi:phage FluMu protein gp41